MVEFHPEGIKNLLDALSAPVEIEEDEFQPVTPANRQPQNPPMIYWDSDDLERALQKRLAFVDGLLDEYGVKRSVYEWDWVEEDDADEPIPDVAPAEKVSDVEVFPWAGFSPTAEQAEVQQVFGDLLASTSADGGRKRAAGLKPSWKVDTDHKRAIFSHLGKWVQGEEVDPDSGVHPLVHLAWRALAVAYQETKARENWEELNRWLDSDEDEEPIVLRKNDAWKDA